MMQRFLFLLSLLFGLSATFAAAHVLTDSQSREVHVIPQATGPTEIVLRFPLTFAYAAELGRRADLETVMQAPFLRTEAVSGRTFYRLDVDAAAAAAETFAQVLLRDIAFRVGGAAIDAHLRHVSVVRPAIATEPPAGREALTGIVSGPPRFDGGYVSELTAILALTVPELGAGVPLAIEITPPGIQLPPTLHVANRYVDHRTALPQSVVHDGFWPPVVTLSGDPRAGFAHFVRQGTMHILGGLDHVLFVLCLSLTALHWRGLLAAVTGFTLGHSATLSAAVLGVVPASAWALSVVNVGVAMSVLVMAILVLLRQSGPAGFWVALTFGLLHGFGFAAMLEPMLGMADPRLPLLGFNLGIEIGQLLIILPLAAGFLFMDRTMPLTGRVARVGGAIAALVLAALMTVDRGGTALAEVSGGTPTARVSAEPG